MRIIGNIEHPSLKISVFRMENRTSVKFENALYEQTFKLGDDERFATLEGVAKIVDAVLLDAVSEGFRQLHTARLGALARAFPMSTGAIAFEEII